MAQNDVVSVEICFLLLRLLVEISLRIPWADWSDKLVQEGMRLLLNAYFEPQFSDHSHGFRPERGCPTALREIKKWDGTAWFIEGDLSKCFDKLDHQVLLALLREHIHDEQFIRLINELWEAGYLEDWKVRFVRSKP